MKAILTLTAAVLFDEVITYTMITSNVNTMHHKSILMILGIY